MSDASKPVARIIGRVGSDLRIGWLRPELVDVGVALYAAGPPVVTDDMVSAACKAYRLETGMAAGAGPMAAAIRAALTAQRNA
jgi:hypothetical protein